MLVGEEGCSAWEGMTPWGHRCLYRPPVACKLPLPESHSICFSQEPHVQVKNRGLEKQSNLCKDQKTASAGAGT